MMNITVNDEKRTIDSPCTVAELVRSCGLAEKPCAVEVNRALVPKSAHPETALADGDTIEIVTLVGGG